MKLQIDRRIYSDACLSKTIYSLSNNYLVNRTIVQEHYELLDIEPLYSENEIKNIKNTFLSTLNDYKLRQIIEDETHDIRTILYAKAFADFEDINEEDV